ncbi:MAG: T9SS type A sorting domain-containing protein, partial [Bacteroidota bacterium]
LFLFIFSFVQAQLPSYTLVDSYDFNELDDLLDDLDIDPFFISAEYEVDVYNITYETPGPDGNLYLATGSMLVPKNYTCPLPLAAYCHGTVHHATGVPSYGSDELTIGLLFATVGNVLILPDYLGLGDSDLPYHPYVHAASQSMTTINGLRTARILADEIGFSMNGQLFLFGYSQGGHAAMATHKRIEEAFSNEFQVTASAPMSGPYDISGAQADVITLNQPYPTPGYLPYVMFAYNEVYDLFVEPEDILVPPYDQTLQPIFFDKTITMGQFNAACPSIPNQVLQPQVLQDFQNDPDHFFRVALRDNDVHDWTPQAPIHMFGCIGDDQVSYQNTENAYSNFIANGATDILKTDFGNFDHGGCVELSLLGGKFFFDSFYDLDNGMEFDFTIQAESALGAQDASITVQVTGGVGNFQYIWSTGSNTASVDGLSDGQEISLTVIDDLGCERTETVIVDPTTDVFFISAKSLKVFPNPSFDAVQIELPDGLTDADFRLWSSTGQLIQSFTVPNTDTFVLERDDLPQGIYYVQITGKQAYQARIVWL